MAKYTAPVLLTTLASHEAKAFAVSCFPPDNYDRKDKHDDEDKQGDDVDKKYKHFE